MGPGDGTGGTEEWVATTNSSEECVELI